jgi:transmembrane sensor
MQFNPNADTEKIMAWKDNSFHFHNDNIETIMNQLSRWYHVEIVYEGSKPTGSFTALISRDRNVSAIFPALEQASHGAAHFRVEGKKIIVTK